MSNPVIYLAGPMTGIDGFNYSAFEKTEYQLDNLKFEVINPATHDVECGFRPWEWKGNEPESVTGFDVEKALEWDLRQIKERAWGMVVLPLPTREWKSKGLDREVDHAVKNNVPIFYLTYESFDNNGELTGGARVALVQWKRNLKERTWKSATINGTEYPVNEVGSASFPAIINKVPSTTYVDGGFITTSQPPFIMPNELPKEVENRWTGEVRTVSSTGGEKGVKLARYDLLPTGPLHELAEHYGRGAEKYDDNQWRKGYEWSKSFAALMRHAQQFWGGEDFDEETGSNHMAAVAWHAFTLLEFYQSHPEFDDRFSSKPIIEADQG